MRRWFLALSFFCSAALAADPAPVITSERGNVLRTKELTVLYLQGFTPDELKTAKPTVEPDTATFKSQGWTFDDKLMMFFSADNPGTYRVTVTLNKTHFVWRGGLVQALKDATAAKIKDADLAEFTRLALKMEAAYPTKSAMIEIVVQSPAPSPVVVIPTPPLPSPAPAPVPAQGLLFVVFVEQYENTATERIEKEIKDWIGTQSPDKITYYIIVPDTKKNSDQQKSYLAKIEGQHQTAPYIFISQEIAGSLEKSVILWRGPLPSNSQETIGKLQTYLRPAPITPVINNPYKIPTRVLVGTVQPLVQFELTRVDAENIARVVATEAARIEKAVSVNDPTPTTEDTRAYLSVAGRELGLVGKYPGLPQALERVTSSLLGPIRQTTMDDAELLYAIAWAFVERGVR